MSLAQLLEPIVGRDAERAALTAGLRRGRLVTLLGPGGVGKTRLALDAAAAADGEAVWVALDGVEHTPGLLAAVGAGLALDGVPGEGADALGARIGRVLHDRGPTLLVCDNMEQVAGGARWLGRWLAAAPGLTILVTSRVVLALAAERVIDVGPMTAADAQALFRARAATAGAGVADDAPGVDALLDRLDRVPLAIELAAARARLLPPAALLERLDAGQIGLGRGAWRDRPERQLDLAASFAWSWRLLNPDEQADLARCAVFRGVFDADAAAAVLLENGLDGLVALLDHSVLRRAGEGRFAVFGTVRDFARREGPPGVLREAAERHRAWFVSQGEARAAEAYGPEGVEVGRWLVRAQPDLVAAIGDALAQGAAGQAVAGLRALRPLCYTGAISPAYAGLLDRACASTEAVAAGWARCLRGELARLRGDLRAAEADLERAVAIEGDPRLSATARAELGIVAHELGDLAAAAAHHQAALHGFEAIGDRRGVGRALGSIAVTRHVRGDADGARDAYEQAIDLLAAVGDRRSWAIFTSNLGDLHLESSRLGEARACYEDARRALLTIGDRRIAAVITGNLGGVLLAEGEVESAIARRREAVEGLTAVGDHRLAAVFTGYLGLCRHVAGELEAACADYGQAERALTERGDRRHTGIFAAHRAAALAARGDPEGAAGALEAAEAALAELDEPAARAVPAIHRGHLLLARGDRAAAEACLALGDDASEDQQMARRLLRAALGAREEPAPSARLRLARDGHAFEAPGVGVVDLGRRYTLHRLLAALLELRLRSPGAGIDLDGLRRVGWPGEQMSHASGANRVYVAIATLRKEGLGDLLLKRPSGYLLDPKVTVEVDDDLT